MEHVRCIVEASLTRENNELKEKEIKEEDYRKHTDHKTGYHRIQDGSVVPLQVPQDIRT